MSERSRWEEMDRLGSSRSFGVFRDVPKPRMKPASKVLLVIACLSATVLFICFTTLSITQSRSNNKIEALRKKAWERSNESNILSQTTKTTMIDRKIDESTLEQREHVKAFKFPEERNNKIKFPEGEEEETDLYGDIVVSRRGKTMEVQKRQKGKQHFFTPHHYSDLYPQLENYKNTHDFKRVQDVIGYVHKTPHLIIGPDGRPAVKFTGVYLKTPDDDYEELNFNQNPQNPSLNGQPYASDPLKHYKPSHPSEINNLASFSSDFDTGPRFSNKIVRPTTIPKDSATIPSQTQITQAIFHPFETLSTSRPDKRQKPLKILLDIYPVTREVEHGQVYPHGRKTRYKQPSYHTTTVQPNSNRMIVHLNLYPKKSKQKRTQYLTSLVPGGGDLEERMFDGSGEIDDEYRTVRFQGEASRIDMGDVGYPTEEMDEPSFQEELTTESVLNKQEEKATEVYEVRNEKDPEIMGDYVFEQEDMENHEEQERLLGMELEKMKVTNSTYRFSIKLSTRNCVLIDLRKMMYNQMCLRTSVDLKFARLLDASQVNDALQWIHILSE
ncbi:uncharacterized protein LOC106668986 [Cimex lectularius]|uniref:Uncharacterized protein n=1 Tax=Cimex lectularius TaxID=79782 RepID=A0A8I6SNZ4_CIMLE|nr:uncharacterized protein LOC106668986 [Cimex lectularius]